MTKIRCPLCASQNILFGKDFIQYRYWNQSADEPVYYYEFEYGDDAEEVEEQNINCTCLDCNHIWSIDGDIYDYLDG